MMPTTFEVISVAVLAVSSLIIAFNLFKAWVNKNEYQDIYDQPSGFCDPGEWGKRK